MKTTPTKMLSIIRGGLVRRPAHNVHSRWRFLEIEALEKKTTPTKMLSIITGGLVRRPAHNELSIVDLDGSADLPTTSLYVY